MGAAFSDSFSPRHGPRARCARVAAVGLALLVAALAGAAPAAAKPERIVSLNLCADQIVMMLVERTRIASLTFLAADPHSSVFADEVDGIHLNFGQAEEILPLEPDLVLAWEGTTRATVLLLKRFGFNVVEVPPARTLDGIRESVRRIAAAVGEPERGAALIAEFDTRLAAVAGASGARPTAALYWAKGYTSGFGTLGETIVTAAGFENLGSRLGLAYARLPVETLLLNRPDVLVLGVEADAAPALAVEVLRHPAIRNAFGGTRTARIPGALFACGTPSIVEVIETLAQVRAGIAGTEGRR